MEDRLKKIHLFSHLFINNICVTNPRTCAQGMTLNAR